MILIIDDDIAIRTSLKLLLKKQGYEVQTASGPEEVDPILAEGLPELIILDMNFSIKTTGEEGLSVLKKLKTLHPQIPVILITAWGNISLAVEGMKLGAADFIQKPWQNDYLIQAVGTALSLSQSEATGAASAFNRKELDQKFKFENIIGEDEKLLQILRTIGRVAPTDASILIQGESGTGKELIAEAIHNNSKRKHKPFVKVNLGGMHAGLFESEMFGHKRGAFTDAHHDRIGRFGMADGGTIFLDEIGDLDMSSQVKLLRVLQDRTYEMLGDSRTRKVNVRIVCATHHDLSELVRKGTFREDLFYRINLITVKLPALRERPKDVSLLVNHFVHGLQDAYAREGLEISRKAMRWLKELPYPGNIRELKNLVERTVLVTESDSLEQEHFEAQFQSSPRANDTQQLPAVGSMTLEQMEAAMIQKAMKFHKYNISKVARALGMSRAALYRRLDKYNIPYEGSH